MSSNITVAALRDMGCVRTNNEDNFAYDPAHNLYIVCDGMGGMAAGEVASSIACSIAIQTFAAQPADTPVLTRLSLAIRAANDAVREASQQNPGQQGMGTTLVAAVLEGNKLYVGNVGDSRAYLLQNSVCVQLTVDHSYINELVRNGTVRVEDIHSVNLKGLESVITRAIGAAPVVDPDFFAVDLRENDTLLMASDGLTRYVNSENINSMIDPQDLDQSCQRLIDAAKDAGGADNITCLLLRYNAPTGQVEADSDQVVHTSVEPLVSAPPAVHPSASVDALASEPAVQPPTTMQEPVAAVAPDETSDTPWATLSSEPAEPEPPAEQPQPTSLSTGDLAPAALSPIHDSSWDLLTPETMAGLESPLDQFDSEPQDIAAFTNPKPH